MEEKNIISNNKIILSKKIKLGSVYLIKLFDNMLAVVAFQNNNKIYSRSFIYSNSNKKTVTQKARQNFKFILNCFYKNNLTLLEEC